MEIPLVIRLVEASQKKKAIGKTYLAYQNVYYNSELGHQVVTGGGNIESSPAIIDTLNLPSTGRIL